MSAFNQGVSSIINEVINLHARDMGKLITTEVTALEIVNSLFANEDELAFLKRAKEIGLRSTNYSSYINVQVHDLCSIMINTDVVGVPLPRGFEKRQMKLPDDRLALLKAYCERKLALSDHWSNVSMLFRYLNDTCSSAQQVRYIMPSVVGLLSYDKRTRSLASKLTPLPKLRSKPTIYPEMRPIIETSNRLIAQAKLIKTDVERGSDPYELKVSMNGYVMCGWNSEITVSRIQL